MKTTWQEYDIDDDALHEWLPWGGLVHPSVLKNKDLSLTAIYSYQEKYLEKIEKELESFSFVNGWSFWVEKQKIDNVCRFFITVTWNPFFDNAKKINPEIRNTLSGTGVSYEKMIKYFCNVIQELQEYLSQYCDAQLLKNEEILSYLKTTLAMENEDVKMPDLPLYLDAFFAQTLQFQPLSETFQINGYYIGCLSLMGIISDEALRLVPNDCRIVRRLLIFDKKAAEDELENYTKDWCKDRDYMWEFLCDPILKELNGYYTTSIVFFNKDLSKLEMTLKNATLNFSRMELPHSRERYRLKDVWWGSLPAVFRANVVSPLIGLKGIQDLII